MKKPFRRRKKNNKGFSLMEVLVTLAIVGVVATLIAGIITQGSRFFRKEQNTIDLQNELQECSNKISDVLMGASSVEISNVGTTMTIHVHNEKTSVYEKYIVFEKDPSKPVGSLYVFNNAIESGENKQGYSLSDCVADVNIEFDDSCLKAFDDGSGGTVLKCVQPVILNITVKVQDEGEQKTGAQTITLRNKIVSFIVDGTEMIN